MPFVYNAVRTLAGKPLVDGGDCVALVKAHAPGLKGISTTAWKPGAHVVEVAQRLAPGTAIATFEDGRYPQRATGQHAAFFVSSAGAGIWVMDQWKNDPRKPVVSLRHIPRRGKTKDGSGRTRATMPRRFR